MTRSGGKCYCLFEAQYFIRALNHWDYSEWVVLANSHQGIQEKKRTKQVLFHKMPKSSAQKKKLFPKVSLADTRTHKIMNQKKMERNIIARTIDGCSLLTRHIALNDIFERFMSMHSTHKSPLQLPRNFNIAAKQQLTHTYIQNNRKRTEKKI